MDGNLKMAKTTQLISALLFTLLLPTAGVADTENGQELHDAECLRCHGTEPYMKEDTKLKTIFDLKRQVSMCITMTGAGADWFPEDQDDVVEYMNKAFYHVK